MTVLIGIWAFFAFLSFSVLLLSVQHYLYKINFVMEGVYSCAKCCKWSTSAPPPNMLKDNNSSRNLANRKAQQFYGQSQIYGDWSHNTKSVWLGKVFLVLLDIVFWFIGILYTSKPADTIAMALLVTAWIICVFLICVHFPSHSEGSQFWGFVLALFGMLVAITELVFKPSRAIDITLAIVISAGVFAYCNVLHNLKMIFGIVKGERAGYSSIPESGSSSKPSSQMGSRTSSPGSRRTNTNINYSTSGV